MSQEMLFIIIGVMVVAIILWVMFAKVLPNRKPKDMMIDAGIDIEAFIDALGKLENIKEVEASNSKINVWVVDSAIVNVEGIKQLGASGIVQSNDKITAIFGKSSVAIATNIQQRK